MPAVVYSLAAVSAATFTQPELITLVVPSVVALAAVAIAVWALRTLSKLRATVDVLQQGDEGASIIDALAARTTDIANLRAATVEIADALNVAQRELASALRHTAVVRYDAFGDMGGRMSFSAAMLDDSNDGLIITSIHGRSETRTYLKAVMGGAAELASPEEREAVERACGERK